MKQASGGVASSALVGSSGFVGTTLARQFQFTDFFRSANIKEIRGRHFDLVVCCAAPAQKWIANRDPVADSSNIEALISSLSSVTCDKFVLVSTVDVFRHAIGVTEETRVETDGLHPYGLHRRTLEMFVQDRFPDSAVVRLPGLVGPGLRKNVVFDFLNDNNLQAIDSRGVFQFYPMVNLWFDIQTALRNQLRLIHLTAEPVSVGEVAGLGFGLEFAHRLQATPARYDMQTIHAEIFGGTGGYQYSRRESLQAIRAYAQSEPRSLHCQG